MVQIIHKVKSKFTISAKLFSTEELSNVTFNCNTCISHSTQINIHFETNEFARIILNEYPNISIVSIIREYI